MDKKHLTCGSGKHILYVHRLEKNVSSHVRSFEAVDCFKSSVVLGPKAIPEFNHRLENSPFSHTNNIQYLVVP